MSATTGKIPTPLAAEVLPVRDGREQRSAHQPKSPAGARSLSDFLRTQARQLIAWAVDAELDEFLRTAGQFLANDGRAAVVRNGYHPQRQLRTSMGLVPVRIPKVRSRLSRPVVFRSNLARPYMRRARWVSTHGPQEFVHGLAEGDVRAALRGLMGVEATTLPAAVVARLIRCWESEYRVWLAGPLGHLRGTSLWLDAVVCDESDSASAGSVLMAIGVESGAAERLLAVTRTMHQSAHAWKSLLAGLRVRGLERPQAVHIGQRSAPMMAEALSDVYPGLRTPM